MRERKIQTQTQAQKGMNRFRRLRLTLRQKDSNVARPQTGSWLWRTSVVWCSRALLVMATSPIERPAVQPERGIARRGPHAKHGARHSTTTDARTCDGTPSPRHGALTRAVLRAQHCPRMDRATHC